MGHLPGHVRPGSAALWYGATAGGDEVTFRLFYLFGAVLNVPFLALGTVYLLGGVRRGDRWAGVVGLGSAFSRPACWPWLPCGGRSP